MPPIYALQNKFDPIVNKTYRQQQNLFCAVTQYWYKKKKMKSNIENLIPTLFFYCILQTSHYSMKKKNQTNIFFLETTWNWNLIKKSIRNQIEILNISMIILPNSLLMVLQSWHDLRFMVGCQIARIFR